jgi:hypothetical protein
VLAVLAAVAACGSTAAHPVSAESSPTPSTSVSASPSAPGPGLESPAGTTLPPVPAAMVQAISGGSRHVTVVKSRGSVLAHPAQSGAAALATALAQEPRGSQILGLTLAQVKGFGFGSDMSRSQLAWLVSVDPYGGAYAAGGPACGRLNYVVELIDAGTSQWLMTSSGRQPGLAALPVLGPTPSPVEPGARCGAAVPPVRLGTPAAN